MATQQEWKEHFQLINDREPTLAEFDAAKANGEIQGIPAAQPQQFQQQPQYQQPYPQAANIPMGYQQKSKMAAGLLGIFLGGLGVHNFYLGNTGKAIAQLLISLLSIGFLAWASGIWGLIEGIMILTGSIDKDGKGVPLRD